jgi:transcriptional regulator with XRE-family HTH domain
MGDALEPTTEWGRYLRRVTKRPGWNVAKLARQAGFARQTIFEWIRDGGESVTVASARRISDATGDDLDTVLLAAGNIPLRKHRGIAAALADAGLGENELARIIEAASGLDPDDYVVRRILRARVSVETKTLALERERELQERDRQRRLEEHELRLGGNGHQREAS